MIGEPREGADRHAHVFERGDVETRTMTRSPRAGEAARRRTPYTARVQSPSFMSGPPPAAYRARAPHRALAPYVESLWSMEAPAFSAWQEHVLPHVHVDVVILLRGAYERVHRNRGERVADSRVIGVHVSPTQYAHGPGDRLIGVRLRAGALGAFGIDLPHSELVGAAPLAGDVFGADLDAFGSSVVEAPIDEALASFERLLLRRLAPPEGHAAVAAAIGAVERGAAIADAAALSGKSLRSFERTMQRAVGLPPRTFRALARFGRAVELLDRRHAREGFAPIFELGYADQAHFIREFRRFAGEAPTGRWGRSSLRSGGHAVLEDDLEDRCLGQPQRARLP